MTLTFPMKLRHLLIGTSVSVIALGTITVATPTAIANAASSGSAPAISISASGWITYNNSTAEAAQFSQGRSVTVQGNFDASGNCVVIPPHSLVPVTTTFNVVETAFNPSLCQEQYAEGYLSVAQANSFGAGIKSSSPNSGPDVVCCGGGGGTTINVYYKNLFRDPANYVITSLALNQQFNFLGSGTIQGVVLTSVVPYAFPWDGWYGSAPISSSQIRGTTDAQSYGWNKQQNYDFYNWMVSEGQAIWCTGSNPAVFVQDMTMNSYDSSRGLVQSYVTNGGAVGACANLVRFNSTQGIGTTS